MNILNQIIYHQTYIGIDQQNLTNINFLVGLIGEIHSLFQTLILKFLPMNQNIEIHGCNTAFDGELDTLSSFNIISFIQSRKKRSVVIGHADFSSPNRGGTKDISKQDYRHETRIIYNNGKVIAKTRREGRLSAEFIKNALGG